jgi:hypothetical protein
VRLKFYADVHETKKNKERCRITYTTDGTVFKHVDSFSGIPAGPGDQLFVDTIPPSHTDGAIELLGRGWRSIIISGGLHCLRRGELQRDPGRARRQAIHGHTTTPTHERRDRTTKERGRGLYYLRRLTLLKKVRGELRLPKSARGDIRALMKIGERWFRRVTGDFLVMRRMILAHRSLSKTHQQLLNKYKALSEAEREVLRLVIKSLEVQMEEVARMIAEGLGKDIRPTIG